MARKQRKVSQRELSKRLGAAPTYISKIERGERGFDVIELLDICVALNMDISKFVKSVFGI